MDRLAEDFIILAIYIAPFFLLLAVGGIISDYVLPRCPRLLRLLERLLQVDLGGDDL